MKIDYFSDPHFDAYFSPKRALNEKAFKSFYEPYILANERKLGEVLIIAGDLSHDNKLSLQALKYLKSYYSHIVCVLGNHDYYLSTTQQCNQFATSFERVKKMRELINNEEGLYCLGGD
jgi:DNA repair exonuclease SbcCD nuclease subunit